MTAYPRLGLLLPLSIGCLLCLFVLGCKREVIEADFAKIHKGMTIDEVEAILGKGDPLSADDVKTEVGTAASEGLTLEACDTWMMWGNRNKSGIVGFQDGVVRQTIFR